MSSCSTWHLCNGLCPISMVYHLLAPITFANFDKCDLLQHFLESTKVFQEYTAALLVTYTSKRVSIINEKKLIPFRKYFLVDLTYECQAEIWCKCIAAHNFDRENGRGSFFWLRYRHRQLGGKGHAKNVNFFGKTENTNLRRFNKKLSTWQEGKRRKGTYRKSTSHKTLLFRLLVRSWGLIYIVK